MAMFETVVRFLDRLASGSDNGATFSHDEKTLAVAALFYRMVSIDGVIREVERETLRDVLHSRFKIQVGDLEKLIEHAWREHKETAGLFPFTSIIAHEYTPEECRDVVEAMWSIAISDTELHPFEEDLIARVAELLEVSPERPRT